MHVTERPLQTRSRYASAPEVLKLATYNRSPDRSTKSTISHVDVLYVLVGTRFQVLFHSPPGVLFTFPSQYCSTIGPHSVFRLGGWSPRLLRGFLVSADTPDPSLLLHVSPTRLSLPSVGLPIPFGYAISSLLVLYPGSIAAPGLASSDFARHYSRNLV